VAGDRLCLGTESFHFPASLPVSRRDSRSTSAILDLPPLKLAFTLWFLQVSFVETILCVSDQSSECVTVYIELSKLCLT